MSALHSRREPALRLARAALAVPPGRLWARLVHETNRRAAESLPRRWRERLAGAHLPPPDARPGYLAALARELAPGEPAPSLWVEVLGHPYELAQPIDWEPAGKSRLWHFTLHYFDWALAALSAAENASAADGSTAAAGSRAAAARTAARGAADPLSAASTSATARAVFDAMRSWTADVPFGSYDAWHPYPTSKRLVSWTYLLASFPELATPDLERSHWLQVRYLARNVERHAGGNHLLQNLCALVVAGLRYEGVEAEEIVERALRALIRELPRQVTTDGCHHELAAAYHLQVVVMLAETLLSLSSAGLATPTPLLGALAATAAFAERMRLPDGSYPLWSDSSRDTVAPLDAVVALAKGALAASTGSVHASDADASLPYPYGGLLDSALAAPGRRPLGHLSAGAFVPQAPRSGYHHLHGAGLVAVFDGADTGAHGNPGHGHADCLNVDVHTSAGPLIVESGTSTYDPCADRDRERGTAAHNTVEVAGLDQTELWGAFRVGRPARALDHADGHAGGWQWASAGHDGYVSRCGVTHRRWVGVNRDTVVVLDQLELAGGATPVPFRLSFHLAPGVHARPEGSGAFALGTSTRTVRLHVAGLAEGDAATLVPASAGVSFHAERFGHKLPRALIEVTGTLSPGRRYLATVVSPRAARLLLRREGGTVKLVSGTSALIAWSDVAGPLVPTHVLEEVKV